ncbi:hypothetical protein [Candidatus Villigracilis proximus]|uniref:hypothetical protein n=1 Tax=Candidatus Villigracilis proximus TaxID=3140683 RepID=UPI0031ECC845
MKIAKLYTGKSAFIVGVRAFHGKTMGALSLMGKADYRAPMGNLYAGRFIMSHLVTQMRLRSNWRFARKLASVLRL